MLKLKSLEATIVDYKKSIDQKIKEAEDYMRESMTKIAPVEEANITVGDLTGNPSRKKIMEKLIKDIDKFIEKAQNGIKNKTGSPAIRSFLKEVKTKMKNIFNGLKESDLKEAVAGTIENLQKLENQNIQYVNFKENSPTGSLEALRDKVRAAMKVAKIFNETDDDYVWLQYIFPNKIIVEYKEKYYQVEYATMTDIVTFGAPVEVTQEYVIKESTTPIKESEVTNIKEGKVVDFTLDLVSLKEADFDPDMGTVKVILIEAGTNEAKRRHYPVSTIQESAPNFAGLKMYINHPTKEEERSRPERDLRDWVSTIESSYADGGKAIGVVKIHDTWLKERMKDPVARQHIALSINAGGKVSMGKIDGKDMQIVEKIVMQRTGGPASVDWVTEAGARGRVATLLESRREDKNMLENITLSELKEARADLVESIVKEAQVKTAELETQLTEANGKIAGFETAAKMATQKETISSILKESKLPAAAQTRIQESFTSLVENEAELKESVTAAIKKEAEYINGFSKKGKINLGEASETKSLVESHQKELDSRMGFKEEKEDEE